MTGRVQGTHAALCAHFKLHPHSSDLMYLQRGCAARIMSAQWPVDVDADNLARLVDEAGGVAVVVAEGYASEDADVAAATGATGKPSAES